MPHLSLNLRHNEQIKAFEVYVVRADLDRGQVDFTVATELYGERTARDAFKAITERALTVQRAFWAAGLAVYDNTIADSNHLRALTYTLDTRPYPVL